MKWLIVCMEKRKEALGVRNLSLLNYALLDKWIYASRLGSSLKIGYKWKIWEGRRGVMVL